MTIALLLIATQIADVVTTAGFLRLGGEERFWISKWLLDNVGVAGFALVKVVLGLWFAALYLNGEMPEEIAFALLALYAYLLVNNVLLIQKLKKKRG